MTPLLAAAPAAFAQAQASAADFSGSHELVVTASTVNLVGRATTSSQGAVTKQEIELRPVYRVGQLLETVPGLVATSHSGEGKANQYLLRGFNLDHGTDLATFVDGMPVNMRTHGHGQGYTDVNFMLPDLASGIRFSKGPYFASEGDYASVGAVHVTYLDQIPTTVSASAGTLNDQRLFAATTQPLANGRLLAAGELVHLDGPWTHPDNLRKVNAVLRYSQGERDDGFSLTGMYYRALWNSTTDQPVRAITQGLIDRYGTLDPSDGGQSRRISLSAAYAHAGLHDQITANAYVIVSRLTLWNNFTHFLDDPVNGDQHAQDDRRTILGGAASYTRYGKILGVSTDTVVGVQTRYDDISIDRIHTLRRQPLNTEIADKVQEASVGTYVENTTYWTNWLRTVAGLREDYYHADIQDLVPQNSGTSHAALFQPKGSLIVGPFMDTELYVSAGRGFHSNDVRGSTKVFDPANPSVPLTPASLLVKSTGYEVGLRTTLGRTLQASVTLFEMSFDSELVYDPESGTTSADRPSRRRGVEFTGQYRPWRWLELNANIAFSHARFTDVDPAGQYIPDAPEFIGSLGVLINNLGPWSAGVEFRDLGPHPLIENNSVRSNGDSEWNMNLGYKVTPSLKLRVDVFNVFGSKDDAADYFYTDRLPGEPAAGVADLHIHPLEPRSARFSLTKVF